MFLIGAGISGCNSTSGSDQNDDLFLLAALYIMTQNEAGTTSAVGMYKIADTAQTKCFNSTTGALATCAGTGYDADYTTNAQSYTDNGDQTITDNVTGLMWTRTPDTNDSFTNEAGATDYGYYWSSTTHESYDANKTDDDGYSASCMCFGECPGYIEGAVRDVHGAGAQRSNYKQDVSKTTGAITASGATGSFYYHGPQGDVLRNNNYFRCVRTESRIESLSMRIAPECETFGPGVRDYDSGATDRNDGVIRNPCRRILRLTKIGLSNSISYPRSIPCRSHSLL